MKKRMIGNHGMVTSELGFGCMGLNYHRGPKQDKAEMIKVVHEAIEAGITMFDTAAVYGPYTNEELLGEALVGYRDRVQIATKGGFKINGLANELDSRPSSLEEQLEGSLKRLKTDYIDLYYIHRVDPNVPIEEVAMAMKKFKEQGKIRHWGLSEAGVETIRKAHAIEPLTAVEYEYSMWWREIEQDVLPVLEELGIGLVAYSPLGRGFLTGKLSKDATFDENDNRGELPRFQKEAMEANQIVIEFLDQIAKKKQATSAQVALAWLLAQKDWIVPIPGTTKLSRIHENIGSTNITFSNQELADIDKALATMQIVGERYPESEKQRTGN